MRSRSGGWVEKSASSRRATGGSISSSRWRAAPTDAMARGLSDRGKAVARVSSSPLEMLVMTDSIQATEAVRVSQNIRQISIAPLLGEAMRRIAESKSVSSLFH